VESFEGKLAVVTGGGTGMGRELVVQLAAEGASVATCDVNLDTLGETAELAMKEAPAGVEVTTHECDVADAASMDRFRDEVVERHGRDHVNLVFNNAGVGGGGAFILGERADWERTFDICWGGVYNGCRSFVPLLVKSTEGYLVNTSSVNGFWATLGLGMPHTAYSAAKFAVKGFTEALLEDFKLNAPHVKVAVVMPGHIGTDIIANSRKILDSKMPEGVDESMVELMATMFKDNAPLSAAQAATVILDGVKAGKWRILVGDDAVALDKAVRADPEGIYDSGMGLGTMLGGSGPA
jgi:NAD(P)-dependent dehydrogenase (short-subunit alcohol dehydrogenase family)